MRGLFVLLLIGACSFEPGALTPDAPMPDVPPDVIAPTWSVDATSKKGVPADATEWTDLLVAQALPSSAPDHVWLMQEATGSLGDTINTTALDPQNGPTYRNVVSGWTRAAVGTVDTAGNQGFITGTLGNLDGRSYLLLAYVAVVAAPASERSLLGIGGGPDHRFVAVTPSPTFKATGAGVTPATGTANPMTAVHPVIMEIAPINQSYVVYTDQEKLTVPWTSTAGAGNLLMVGNATIGAANARFLYAALWTGTKAQLDDASIKRMLQGLGWTVTGY